MRNYEKFYTPDHIADLMASMIDVKDGQAILEPSAGNGSLVKAIMKKNKEAIVFAFEINEGCMKALKDAGARVIAITNFLTIPVYATFSHCIANPPFGNDNDISRHVSAMRKHVKDGGTIVCIVPDDFNPTFKHEAFAINNWSKNSDGTETKIKIIKFLA